MKVAFQQVGKSILELIIGVGKAINHPNAFAMVFYPTGILEIG